MKCTPVDFRLFKLMKVAGVGPERLHMDHSSIPYDEWRALRRHYIGASEISTILGHNRYSGPFDLACIKLGLVGPDKPGLAMRMGTFFEPAIRAFFADEMRNGHIHIPGGIDPRSDVSEYPFTLRHKSLSMFCCNLDGVIQPSDSGSVWALEIKDAGTYAATDLRRWMAGDKPGGVALMYWIQIQAQLAVSGLERALAVIRCDKALMCGPIYRNPTAIDSIERQVRAYWDRYLATDKTPPVDRHSSDVLNRMYPPDSAEGTIEREDLAGDVAMMRESMATLNREIKDRKAEQDRIRNRLRQIMGDAEIMTLGEGIRPVRWKVTTRKSGATYRTLRL